MPITDAAPLPKPQLMMKRSLEDLEPLLLPKGVTVRHFQPGDASVWDHILCEAFGWEPTQGSRFESMMRPDPAYRAERILFLCENGVPVATTSAWHAPEQGSHTGTIHWVAVLKSFAGHGYGRLITLACLHQMKREGRTTALLTTDDFRVPAIVSYLKLDFLPCLVHENQRQRWHDVLKALNKPQWIEASAAILKGPLHEPPAACATREDLTKPGRHQPRRRFNLGRPDFGGPVGGGDPDYLADESLYKPSQLGQASCELSNVVAGAACPESFMLEYTTGPAGLTSGNVFQFAVRGQQPLGFPAQVQDASKPAYCTVHGPSHVTLQALPLGFKVTQGSLRPGDQVHMHVTNLKDARWHPVAGRRVLYPTIIIHPDEPQLRLPEHVVMNITHGKATHVEVTTPATADSQTLLRTHVTVRDANDNRVSYDGMIELVTPQGKQSIPMRQGFAAATIEASSTTTQTTPLRVKASATELGFHATSNPCVVTQASDNLNAYFGDMHCHDMHSEAMGYPDEVYKFAIEDRRLDFLSLSIQSHGGHDNSKWAIHKYMNERYLEEGRFVTLLAFEWQHSAFADKIVHYLGGDQPYLPMDRSLFNTPAKIYEALRQSDAFIISHHIGYPLPRWVAGCDWNVVEDDIERVMEIWSMHGSSEGHDPQDRPLAATDSNHTANAALRKGLKLGMVGGSDTHSGRPGGSAKEPLPYWGGLAGVWAPSLTRRDIFNAIRNRHTFAIHRARIVLKMAVNDSLMGSEIPAADKAVITIDAWAPGKFAKVEIFKNSALLKSIEVSGDEIHITHEDATGGPAYYHCRVIQTDGEPAVSSPVWVG